ncbi:MAG: methyltransferase domain-containing protein [Candidatus Zixiibacteriota bacterium]
MTISLRKYLLTATMHDMHQEFFDRLAAEWDLTFTAEDLERLQHVVNNMPVHRGMQILDLGCGTGILFDMLRRLVGTRGSVTGVDFSMEMAQKAHRNFPFANVHVVDADASELPFGANLFDMAVAFAAFPHFVHQQRALDELHRVLKPGARFYILHLQSSKELAAIHHRVGGAVAKDTLPSAENLRQMFASGQFYDIRIEDHPGLFLASATNAE